MDVKDAIAAAKNYVSYVYAEEQPTSLSLEEVEHDRTSGDWLVTIGFSRPWMTARTRAQEVLESIGGGPQLKRSLKIVTISPDGTVVSMKNPPVADAAE